MGIPFFVRYIKSKGRTNTYRNVILNSLPPFVSSLSIDFPGIIHRSCQWVFGYSENATPERQEYVRTANPATLEYELLSEIGNTLNKIIMQVQPRDVLILATDGVAPEAKINQQRQRRFRTAKENKSGPLFDSNAITPGTDLMMKIDSFLRLWIKENELALPERVIYSSHMVPGEGEHKCFDFFRAGYVGSSGSTELFPDGTPGINVVYGLDADLVILSLLSNVNNLYLMREDIADVLSIDNLRDGVRRELETDTALDDFAVLTYFLGNDFIPHMPSLGDLDASITKLIEIYKKSRTALTKDGEIFWEGMHKFLIQVAAAEPKLMEAEAARPVLYPSRMVEEATLRVQSIGTQARGFTVEKKTIISFDYEEFRGEEKNQSSSLSLFQV